MKHWLSLGGLLALLATGCNPSDGDPQDSADTGRGDAAAADAGPADDATTDGGIGDSGPAVDGALTRDDDASFAGPLFSPDGAAAEAAAADLVAAWHSRPVDDASAQAQHASIADAVQRLRDAGAAGADTIAARCEALPDTAARDHLVCARVLSHVESPGSLAYLDRLARADDTPRPAGAHVTGANPGALARSVAGWALGRRAAAGSPAAVGVLERQVTGPDRPEIRRTAVHTLLRARPRHRIKPRLKALLPPDEYYLIYEVR